MCDRSRRVVRKHVADVLPVLSRSEQLTFLKHTDQGRFHAALTLGLALSATIARSTERSYNWLLNGKAVAQQSLAEQTLLARDSNDPRLRSANRAT